MNLEHHSDNAMDPVDIAWEWVPGAQYGFWRRDVHYEALKALRGAGMLDDITEEELPAGVSPLASTQMKG